MVYNLNSQNGLTTNHVYCTHVDRLGYLWLGTDDGVYRYNGYDIERYTYEDGLPNVDVWHFYEDRKERLWTKSISPQIGFFKHGTYHVAKMHDYDSTFQIYPSQFYEINDTLTFLNGIINKNGNMTLCLIVGDTIHNHILQYPYLYGSSKLLINDKYILRFVPENTIQIQKRNNAAITINKEPDTVIRTRYSLLDSLSFNHIKGFFSNNYIYYTNPKRKHFLLFNIKDCHDTLIKFKTCDEVVHLCYPLQDYLYVLTNKSVYIYDTLLNSVSYDIEDYFLGAINESTGYTHFINNDFWGKCLSTDGLNTFISFPEKSHFKKIKTYLRGYRLFGTASDSLGFWLNNENNILATVANGTVLHTTRLAPSVNVSSIAQSNSDRSRVFTSNEGFWLDHKTGNTSNVLEHYEHIYVKNTDTTYDINSTDRTSITGGILVGRNAVFLQENEYYICGTGFSGVNYVKKDPGSRTITIEYIYDGRFSGVTYSKKDSSIIAYNKNNIVFIDLENNIKKHLTPNRLKAIGIQSIENIYADHYGNLFIKDYAHLYLYNSKDNSAKRVFTSFNLEKAQVKYCNSKICIAGGFGVLLADVTGVGEVNNTRVFPNTKRVLYKNVSDLQFSNSYILINTDNGFYAIDNGRAAYKHINNNNYKVAIAYEDTSFNLNKNDTIHIKPNTNSLHIDIIKPTGTGELKIDYILNGKRLPKSGKQLVLPHLAVGQYYELTISAFDDVWLGHPVNYYIYVQPKWWQTTTAKTGFVIIGIIIVALIIVIVANTTRKIVNRNNEKRTRERELELKSIYSQINPHFIFNTLSTAQYYVRKKQNKEAENHISRFSELLRAYISSSRNKYISISEEIDNLNNYLELQLNRFDDKFEYEIIADDSAKQLKIPSMLLQPIVENAINHGLFHKHSKGFLKIFFVEEKRKNQLVCTVDDNGIGRAKSKELKTAQMKKTTSYGTILIKELIDTLNKYEQINIDLKYIDKKQPDTGTTAIITIHNYQYVQ